MTNHRTSIRIQRKKRPALRDKLLSDKKTMICAGCDNTFCFANGTFMEHVLCDHAMTLAEYVAAFVDPMHGACLCGCDESMRLAYEVHEKMKKHT